MSITVAAGILGFAKDALGLIGDARGADLAQRNRLADYCARVGDALASIVAELESGRTPHGKCAELRAYAEQFEDVAQGVIGVAEARRVATALAHNHDVEGMAMALSAGTERDEAMRQLAEASGRFIASVHRLRV